ncbi:MAG: L-alanine exporter AlaE, partial [Candidatus Anstonellales archaeon]
MEKSIKQVQEDKPNKIFDIKKYFIDNIAIVSEANPVFAFFEVFISNLSVKTSLNSRILGTFITFIGFGTIFSKGRDMWRKIFRVNQKTNEKIQAFHDFIYAGILNLVTMPPTYALSQYMANEELDMKKILTASVIAAIVSGLNGPFVGYAIDIYRDLSNIKECERTFYKKLKINNKSVKKIGIYALT